LSSNQENLLIKPDSPQIPTWLFYCFFDWRKRFRKYRLG